MENGLLEDRTLPLKLSLRSLKHPSPLSKDQATYSIVYRASNNKGINLDSREKLIQGINGR
jgi:hypothetical protein